MANFHIVYDEKDPELGEYFQACKQDLIKFINDNLGGCGIFELGALYDLNDLDDYLRGINAENFIFVVYSHGDEASLFRASIPYISSHTNASLLVNSFFYAVSCSSASQLGPEIIKEGGHGFIGYGRPFLVLLQHQETSVNCANSGLQMFILGQRAEQAFEAMKAFYTTQIDRLLQFGNIVAASILADTRESLVLLGDPQLVIASFP